MVTRGCVLVMLVVVAAEEEMKERGFHVDWSQNPGTD